MRNNPLRCDNVSELLAFVYTWNIDCKGLFLK
jgi:hypothetical protein